MNELSVVRIRGGRGGRLLGLLLEHGHDRVALADLALGDHAGEPLPVIADGNIGRAGRAAPPDPSRLGHALEHLSDAPQRFRLVRARIGRRGVRRRAVAHSKRTTRAARDAHQAGVEAAVSYLDGQVGTRTGRDGAKHVAGSGLVAVGFTHRVSRGGDPLPHTHLVIVNRTQGPDGQWRTLDSRDLLAHRQAADAIYRAAYQTELTRTLGIGWAEPDRWGNRAIVGMPPELVTAFSKRHEQISAELERLATGDAPHAQDPEPDEPDDPDDPDDGQR